MVCQDCKGKTIIDNQLYQALTQTAFLQKATSNTTLNKTLTRSKQQLAIKKRIIDTENKLTTDLTDIFEKTEARVIERISSIYKLTPQETEYIYNELQSMKEPFTGAISDGITSAMEIGGEQATSLMNSYGFKGDFEGFDKAIMDIFENRAEEAATQGIDTITSQIMDNLAKSEQEGYGYSKAADELSRELEVVKDYNLERISRTEIHSAQGQANHLQMIGLGAEYKKWITARDDLVRGNDPKDEADHVVMDGEIAKIDEPYSNGLMYPGDMNGDLSEFINCRCTEGPFIMPLGKEAPDGPFFEDDL